LTNLNNPPSYIKFSADEVQANQVKCHLATSGIALSTLQFNDCTGTFNQPIGEKMDMKVCMEIPLGNGEETTAQSPLVLVVEDNEDNLMLLTFLLEQLDCQVVTAIEGRTALDLTQRCRPSLILLDMMLPDVDGLAVLCELKQNPVTAEIPVIAVTAMARTQDRERILAAGCNEYVTKPYNVDEIETLLRQYLSSKVED
jgi:CheY-like chemotaxis protein